MSLLAGFRVPDAAVPIWLAVLVAGAMGVLLIALAGAMAWRWWLACRPGEFALWLACRRGGIKRKAIGRLLRVARERGIANPAGLLLCPSMLRASGCFDEVSAALSARIQSGDETHRERGGPRGHAPVLSPDAA